MREKQEGVNGDRAMGIWCGKNMLDVCCVPTSYDENIAMVKTGNECQLSAYMLLLGKFAIVVCCAEVLLQPSFLHVVNTLPAELRHGAYHGTVHCTD